MIVTVKDEKGLWIFIAPVEGLILTEAVKYEIVINKVTFMSGKKLQNVRSRFQFPNSISNLKNTAINDFKSFVEGAETFAICNLGGVGEKKQEEFLGLVRLELNYLSLTQLVYSRRRFNAHLCLSGEGRSGFVKWYMINKHTKSRSNSSKRMGKYQELVLNDIWNSNQKWGFFQELLKVIRGKSGVSVGWRDDILNAALLAGQSQSSTDLPMAFLWNMIAIETLLTHQGDTYSSALPKRVASFIGWCSEYSIAGFEEKISSIYKKRCAFVHSGKLHDIEIKDLLFSDVILANIFFNILKHLDLFKNKDSLIIFSSKVEAEALLGLKSKVRPKTLNFIDLNYSDLDYKNI